MATCKVIGQKSAEAIVGVEAAIDDTAIGNEPRPTMWRTSWRSHPTEGTNAKNSGIPHEPCNAMNPNGGASKLRRVMETVLLMI